MVRRRGLYIPITRSGSSILASLFTQGIDNSRRQSRRHIDRLVEHRELTPFQGFVLKHPIIMLYGVMVGLMWLNYLLE